MAGGVGPIDEDEDGYCGDGDGSDRLISGASGTDSAMADPPGPYILFQSMDLCWPWLNLRSSKV